MKIPIEEVFTVFVECAGEELEVQFREQLVIRETVDAAGGIHFHFTLNDKGTSAVGLTTGAKYHQVGASQVTANVKEPFPVTVTVVTLVNLVSQGSRPAIHFFEQFHITISATGAVTALRTELRDKCT